MSIYLQIDLDDISVDSIHTMLSADVISWETTNSSAQTTTPCGSAGDTSEDPDTVIACDTAVCNETLNIISDDGALIARPSDSAVTNRINLPLPDEFDVFGQSVAWSLRDIVDRETMLVCKHKIERLLSKTRLSEIRKVESTRSTKHGLTI
jgi:hypothetical protein